MTVFGDLLLSSRSRHAKRIHCVLQYGQSDVVQAAVEEVFNQVCKFLCLSKWFDTYIISPTTSS